MTLTTLLPSLRRTLPDPLRIDSWPEFTVPGTTDITVAGVSLVRLVDWCDTPCVHTAAAVVPGTRGRPSDAVMASVIVTRVLAVSHTDDGTDVEIDAVLATSHPVMTEARLIGRTSVAHCRVVRLGSERLAASLPADLGAGDLLAVPCVGATSLREVRPRARQAVEHNSGFLPIRCGK